MKKKKKKYLIQSGRYEEVYESTFSEIGIYKTSLGWGKRHRSSLKHYSHNELERQVIV
jgi:hypothetical protein